MLLLIIVIIWIEINLFACRLISSMSSNINVSSRLLLSTNERIYINAIDFLVLAIVEMREDGWKNNVREHFYAECSPSLHQLSPLRSLSAFSLPYTVAKLSLPLHRFVAVFKHSQQQQLRHFNFYDSIRVGGIPVSGRDLISESPAHWWWWHRWRRRRSRWLRCGHLLLRVFIESDS